MSVQLKNWTRMNKIYKNSRVQSVHELGLQPRVLTLWYEPMQEEKREFHKTLLHLWGNKDKFLENKLKKAEI